MDETKSVRELFDELERVHGSIQAVGDLMSPEPDLHIVRRDRLSCLVSYLADRERAVGEQLKRLLT